MGLVGFFGSFLEFFCGIVVVILVALFDCFYLFGDFLIKYLTLLGLSSW